jgi:hypothetical protein
MLIGGLYSLIYTPLKTVTWHFSKILVNGILSFQSNLTEIVYF